MYSQPPLFKVFLNYYCIPRTNAHGVYYGLVVVMPRPQMLHRSHNNLKNPYRIASLFYICRLI